MINAKDVLELGKKREITSESSSGGDGSGHVAKQSSLDDDQAGRMPMSHEHSISSANPSSMDVESSGSSVATDMKHSVTTPSQYSSVEVVDIQASGSGSEGSGGGSGISNETDIHQSNMQQMAAGMLHLENLNGSEQIVSMEQQQHQHQQHQPQHQHQHIAQDNNNQATLNQDGNHHSVAPPQPAQGLIVHSNDGQSIITHNDQNAASSGIAAPQSLISPNEQYRAQELPSKNSFHVTLFSVDKRSFSLSLPIIGSGHDMDIRNNERIAMESEQYSMQQQQPIQYMNVDHDNAHIGSNNEHSFVPDNVQGNQQCATTMPTIPDSQPMAMEQQYTHEMAQMSDMNQQMQQQQQQQQHDQNAAQNLISSNEIQMQPTLCEFTA